MTSAKVRNTLIALRELLPAGGPDGDEALIWWLFGTDGLEDAFGKALHEELVGTSFVDPAEMEAFRQKLRCWRDAQKPTACLCYQLEGDDWLADVYLAKMDRVAVGSPFMELWRCRLCEESWFVWDRDDCSNKGIEHASAADVSEALERNVWPPRSALWDDEVVSIVDGPHLEEWLRNRGYESLEAWRARNGPELGTDVRARLASYNNRDDILRSSRCFCWNCSARFEPRQISSWWAEADNSGIENDHPRTARCPECGDVAVLGDAGPVSIDEPPFDKTKPKSVGPGLEAAIEGLYEAFEGYSIADMSSLSLYQCRPSPKQLAVLAQHPLRELPDEAVWSMWFYGSMVREAELKHFIPRILEVLSMQLNRLASSSRLPALFNEQLRGVLLSRSWPVEERDALRSWAFEVLDFHLHRGWDNNLRCVLPTLIASVLEMGISAEALLGGLTNSKGALALTDDGQRLVPLGGRMRS